eukprot:scaffold88880_cov33-Phaeocystis_antarctica.AAC.1
MLELRVASFWDERSPCWRGILPWVVVVWSCIVWPRRRRSAEGVGLVSEQCGLRTEHPTGEREQGSAACMRERAWRSTAQRWRRRHGAARWRLRT